MLLLDNVATRMVDVLDVIVVGAGPAGSWLAYRLASAGARVAIYDPSHPREKPCGGGVTGRALALVAPALRQPLASVAIDGAVFEYGKRRAAVPLHDCEPRAGRGDSKAGSTTGSGNGPANGAWNGSPDAAASIPLIVTGRRDLDAALLAAAIGAGADHRPERVIGLRRSGRRWAVETRRGAVEADWIIGADGTNSLVRRHVSRPFARADLSIATGYFVHGVSSNTIDIALENQPPGYLWSFPRPDHLAVGMCAQADASSAPTLLGRARRWIDDHAPRHAALQRYSWPIPSLTAGALAAETPAGAGWMLVGDAAGLVDPITREGIFFALCSADLAASALLAGAAPSAHYADAVRRELYAELTRAARLKARFFQPSFMSLLVTALQRSARIRRVMADLVAGRQPYRGLRRRLLATLEWKLMVGLFGR